MKKEKNSLGALLVQLPVDDVDLLFQVPILRFELFDPEAECSEHCFVRGVRRRREARDTILKTYPFRHSMPHPLR